MMWRNMMIDMARPALSASTGQTLQLGAELAGRVRTKVNANSIRHDVQRPFRILFCGDPGLIVALRSTLLMPFLGVHPAPEATRLLETISFSGLPTVAGSDIRCIFYLAYPQDPGPPVEQLAAFRVPIISIVVDEAVTNAAPTNVPVRGKAETIRVASLAPEDLELRVFPFVVACCRGVEIAVGRQLPILRDAVCASLVREAARTALKIAAASAVVEQVPLLGFVVGAMAAAGDTVAISVVQLNVLLQIGAVFGHDPSVGAAWELVPVIGGGLGWRALSRELAGFIPVAGVAIKGAIAYAGTVVVGEGAAFYYRTGRHMSANDAKKLYHDTRRAAIEMAREVVGRLRGRR